MKISVCIPTFNQAKYLAGAVRSALEQTIVPFEIVVFDDCSTDETPLVLNQLIIEYPLLRVVRQSRNRGIAENTDECLRFAKGEFIIRLDSDDILDPQYAEKLGRALQCHPEAGYAHCAVQEVDQDNNLLKKRLLFRKSSFQTGVEALKAAKDGYKVAANIIMFRRTALEKVEYLTGRPNFGEDYHLTASISASGFGNVYVNEILAFYRIWLDTGKIRQKRKLNEVEGIRRVFEQVLEPGYKKYKLRLSSLEKSRTRLASRHADCLSWNVYSAVEKVELANEIFRLSNAPKVKFVSWLYLNHLGGIVNLFDQMRSSPKKVLKFFFSHLRT